VRASFNEKVGDTKGVCVCERERVRARERGRESACELSMRN